MKTHQVPNKHLKKTDSKEKAGARRWWCRKLPQREARGTWNKITKDTEVKTK